jgi:hypothetical protein
MESRRGQEFWSRGKSFPGTSLRRFDINNNRQDFGGALLVGLGELVYFLLGAVADVVAALLVFCCVV